MMQAAFAYWSVVSGCTQNSNRNLASGAHQKRWSCNTFLERVLRRLQKNLLKGSHMASCWDLSENKDCLRSIPRREGGGAHRKRLGDALRTETAENDPQCMGLPCVYSKARPQSFGWIIGKHTVAPAVVDPYLRMKPIANKIMDQAKAGHAQSASSDSLGEGYGPEVDNRERPQGVSTEEVFVRGPHVPMPQGVSDAHSIPLLCRPFWSLRRQQKGMKPHEESLVFHVQSGGLLRFSLWRLSRNCLSVCFLHGSMNMREIER